ncbi:hypothetical protein MTO96_011273 [Rhipicephalus appendiculatus]
MLSQLCRAQLWSSRKRSFSEEQTLSPNVFSGHFSSEEENDYQDEGESSDYSSLHGCCRCCSTTQEAMVVMQCVQLGSGPLLPMGTLVTALYRHREWICVQTPHGVRGFVRHESCAPLGTLLTPNTGRRSQSSVRDDNLTRNLEPHRVADKLFLEKDIDTFVQDAIDAASASSIC